MALIDAIYKRLPFRKAVQWFLKKVLLPSDQFDQIDREQHDHAFIVAGLTNAQALAQMQQRVTEFIEQGKSLEQFRKEFDQIAQDAGWGYKGGAKWRSRVVAMTNARSAYAAGRYQQMTEPEMLRSRPYWQYRHGGSVEPRQLHISVPPFGWNGLVLPADDPWWNSHFPPNGWGCFPAGTLVATPMGWKLIETLRQGDLVIGGSGDIKPVTAKHTRPYNGKLVRVEIENGFTNLLTPNHRVLTLRGWVAAGSLKLEDVLVQIPQAAGCDKPIADINKGDTFAGDLLMPCPRQGSSAVPKALYADIQVRQKHVNPPPIYREIVNSPKAECSEVVNHRLFSPGRGGLGIWMRGRVDPVHLKPRLDHFGSYLRSFERSSSSELFCCNPYGFAILLGLAKSAVFAFRRLLKCIFPRSLRGFSPAIVGVDPLKGGGCAAGPLFNAAVLDDLLQPSKPNAPAVTDFIREQKLINVSSPYRIANRTTLKLFNLFDRGGVDIAFPHLNSVGAQELMNYAFGNTPEPANFGATETFFEIPEPEGFVDGAPLNLFDSLDDFCSWARSNAVIHEISGIGETHYTNNVHNLSVLDDESYCISIAAVHNCSCKIFSLSQRDLDRLGKASPDRTPQDGFVSYTDRITGQTRLVPRGVDPGFDYTPGKSPDQDRQRVYAEIISRLPPELQEQAREFIRQRQGEN